MCSQKVKVMEQNLLMKTFSWSSFPFTDLSFLSSSAGFSTLSSPLNNCSVQSLFSDLFPPQTNSLSHVIQFHDVKYDLHTADPQHVQLRTFLLARQYIHLLSGISNLMSNNSNLTCSKITYCFFSTSFNPFLLLSSPCQQREILFYQVLRPKKAGSRD